MKDKEKMMAITYADTNEMKDIAQTVSNLCLEYNQEITNLFTKLINVPYETKEWIGESAEYYFKQVLLDKTDFINFGNALNEYSKKILEDALKIEETIAKNIKLESTM